MMTITESRTTKLPGSKKGRFSFSLIAAFLFIRCFNGTVSAQQTEVYYQSPIYKKTEGYYKYLPPSYNTNTNAVPLLIFLHGTGEAQVNGVLNLPGILASGTPPQLIASNQINGFANFIVVSPQSPTANWKWQYVDEIIEHVKTTCRVDVNRIYVTGLSSGGKGAWQYAMFYPEKVAAILPIASSSFTEDICLARSVPVWSFRGGADGSTAVALNNKYNSCIPAPPIPAKLTVISGAAHNSNLWGTVYRNLPNSLADQNPTGLVKDTIFKWLLSYVKNPVTNVAPDANAGLDQTISSTSTFIAGTGTDADGTIASYLWSQVSGPNTSVLTNTATNSLSASGLVPGVYVYQLKVTDNLGATGTDQVTVTVSNTAPAANAGSDLSLTLPANNVTIAGSGTDSDGTIAAYLWTLISGPNLPTFSNATTNTLSASGLIAGTYVFELKVTDNFGAFSTDQVTVTVINGNVAPVANAGTDITVGLPFNSATIAGAGTDSDGTIASYLWSMVSGPNSPTLGNVYTNTLSASGLIAGSYVFELKVTDNSGAIATDQVIVSVTSPTVVYRINAGGALVGDWLEDKQTAPSVYLLPTSSNHTTGSATYSGVNNSDAPNNVFNNNRYDSPIGGLMSWGFPVANGNYIIKLYFYDGTIGGSSLRVFDVSLENTLVLNDFDIYAEFATAANQKNFQVAVTDGMINIDFGREIGNPRIDAIEIDLVSSGSGQKQSFNTEETEALTPSFRIYPVPVSGVSQIEVTLTESDYIKVDLIDQNGILVTNVFKGRAEKGINLIDLNAEGLVPGIYTAVLNSSGTIKTTKVIVVK